MKKSLPILILLNLLASCNTATLQTALQDQIDTKAIDSSVDIKDEVLPTLAGGLDMFDASECTQLKENIFIRVYAHPDENTQTLQFENSYFANAQDCADENNYIGYVTTRYLVRKISLNSSGDISKYNIDLMVLQTDDMEASNVAGLVYATPMDQLDVHHNIYRKIGDTEYMTFVKGPNYVSFPFSYVNSGDSHGQRRSYTNEIMVALPIKEPVVFGGGIGGAMGGGLEASKMQAPEEM